ncbi:MAG: alpha/beta hydrolase [Cyanobacteriota bacterium]|nr:alpha/beta hydrolase [Cyanobacteriota bacterium]
MSFQLSSILNYSRRFLLVILGCFLFLGLDNFLLPAPSWAAEKIIVRYGIFEQSLPVADLREYAETQKVSSALKDFLRYLDSKDKEKVRQALQVKMSLDIVALDKLLDTQLGQKFLSTVSQAVARRDNAGIPALRAAVILGAKSPEGLGIISFLEAYPSKRIVINLSEALEVLDTSGLYSTSSEVPPKDNLSSTALWQLEVQYQILATQDKQYKACLFGDSITAELGNTLGEGTFNFALDGLSTISLIEQIKLLNPANIKCQKTIIAIGGNDAWYGISDELFVKNLKEAIALMRSQGNQQIVLIPAFYSTVAASLDPSLAAPLKRVEEINALIEQVAITEKVPVAAAGIQPLYQDNVLKDHLTTDGDHLNAEGLEIYRQALFKILKATP